MILRKLITLLVAASAISFVPQSATAQDAGQTGQFEDGEFRYQYMADFWRSASPDVNEEGDENETARGHIAPIEVRFMRNDMPKKSASVFERKFRTVAEIILAQPSLRDIHGASLHPTIRIDHDRYGKLYGTLTIFALPIDLSNPKTTNINGRFSTPGAGPELKVSLNDLSFSQGGEIVRTRGRYNGAMLVENGIFPRLVMSNTGAPLTRQECCLDKKPYEEWNEKEFFDKSLPGTKVQSLGARVEWWASRYKGMGNMTESPTSNVGRLMSALLTADWADLMRRVEEAQ